MWACAQITDNFRSKSFACGKPDFASTMSGIISGTSYRFLQADAPGNCPAVPPVKLALLYIQVQVLGVVPICYRVTVISMMNSDILLQILVSAVDLAVLTKVYFIFMVPVHRNSILRRSNKMQQYAGIYLLQNHSTCFGCPSHPLSGVHKTVTAASGTGHSI